jgi:hypothetical protein
MSIKSIACKSGFEVSARTALENNVLDEYIKRLRKKNDDHYIVLNLLDLLYSWRERNELIEFVERARLKKIVLVFGSSMESIQINERVLRAISDTFVPGLEQFYESGNLLICKSDPVETFLEFMHKDNVAHRMIMQSIEDQNEDVACQSTRRGN